MAVIKRHDQGNSQNRQFMLAWGPSMVEYMMAETARLEAVGVAAGRGSRVLTDHPCDTCPSAGLHFLDLPTQCH